MNDVINTDLELFLDLREFLHLLSQLERAHDWIRVTQGHVGRTSERAVRVQSWPWPLQWVIVLFGDAIIARARDWVWLLYGVVTREEHLDDLMVVVVSGEDEGRDIGRELRFFVCPEKRVPNPCSFLLVLAGHIVRVFYDGFDHLGGAFAYCV